MDPKIAKSRKQEQRGATLHGGRRTIGSGNTPFDKGDVKTNRWGIEYKRTDKQQITLKLEDIEKQRKIALLEGRGPLFGFEIGNRDYLVIEAEYLAELEEEAGGQGTGVGTGAVLPSAQRSVLPGAGKGVSETAQRGQGRVQRGPRYTSLPYPERLS